MTEAAIAFDTHKFVKNLTEHGFTEEQAEVLAVEHVAFKAALETTKVELLKWIFAAMIAQATLIVALVKLL